MSASISHDTVVKSEADLPPPRERKGVRSVSPPLSNVPLHRFNYYLALGVALLLAFYAWRLTLWKAEAGGWWNLALGKKSPMMQENEANGWRGTQAYTGVKTTPTGASRGDSTIEERINELASALGMSSKELASAIAVAVHEYVPPATLSSISAHQTGEAVQYLVDPSGASQSDASTPVVVPAATHGFKAAAKAFDAVVGMDEPPNEMD